MINTVEELKRQMTRNMGHGRLYENGDYISTQPIEFGQHNLVKDWVNAGHDPNVGDLLGFCVQKGFPRSALVLLDSGARINNPENMVRTAEFWVNHFSGDRYEQLRYTWLLQELLSKAPEYVRNQYDARQQQKRSEAERKKRLDEAFFALCKALHDSIPDV